MAEKTARKMDAKRPWHSGRCGTALFENFLEMQGGGGGAIRNGVRNAGREKGGGGRHCFVSEISEGGDSIRNEVCNPERLGGRECGTSSFEKFWKCMGEGIRNGVRNPEAGMERGGGTALFEKFWKCMGGRGRNPERGTQSGTAGRERGGGVALLRLKSFGNAWGGGGGGSGTGCAIRNGWDGEGRVALLCLRNFGNA